MKKIIPSLLILFLTSCTLGAKNSAKIIEGKYKFSNNSFVFYKDIKVDNLCINFVSIDSIEKETTIICKVTNKTFNIVTNFSSNENFSVNYTIGEKVYPIPDSYNVIFNIKIDNTIADISTRIQFFTSFKEGEIPLTFILVAIIFIGQQIYDGIFIRDNVSNISHIAGGVIGAISGYVSNRK